MTDSSPERRLAAIMVADIAGFSALMERDETRTFERVRSLRETLVLPLVSQHGGRIIKLTGDGFLAEFASSTAAVQCAVALQERNHAREFATAYADRLHLRIGINIGDILIDGDDVAGDGVNIAARLEPLSPSDGICIAAAVREQIRDDLGLHYRDLGELNLKNIARPIRAYAVAIAGVTANNPAPRKRPTRLIVAGALLAVVLGGALVWQWQGNRSAAGRQSASIASPVSIIVLPFANLTGDAHKAYIADALTTSVSSDLARIKDAYVVPAATAFSERSKASAVEQIGKEFGVRFVLQGSVLASGEHLRIAVQLADTQSGAQLWSETFDGDMRNLFAMQDQVTARIGNSVGRDMLIRAARESEKRTTTPAVADLMLRAAALNVQPRTLARQRDMEALYRQALTLEPDNVHAMAGLGHILALDIWNFNAEFSAQERTTTLAESRRLTERALAIDPDNVRVQFALFFLAMSQDDATGAARAAARLAELDKNNPFAINTGALAQLWAGQPAQALPILEHCIRLDPLHPPAFLFANMGLAYFMQGDNRAAADLLRKAIERNPLYPDSYARLALALAASGDVDGAKATVAQLYKLAPRYRIEGIRISPQGFGRYWESKFVPAARLAGLMQ